MLCRRAHDATLSIPYGDQHSGIKSDTQYIFKKLSCNIYTGHITAYIMQTNSACFHKTLLRIITSL